MLRNTSKKVKHVIFDTGSRAKDNSSKRLIYDREFNAKQGNFIMGRNVSGGLTVNVSGGRILHSF